MSRTKDPDTKYRMKLFVSNSHRYAATADPGYNADRKWVSNTTIWGKLTENLVFEPNLRFVQLTAGEKKKFIFPPEWDISSAFGKTAEDSGKKGRKRITDLIGKCGFCCASCPSYRNGKCKGCNSQGEGDCFTRDCVLKKGIDYCGLCPDFPCDDILTRSHVTVPGKEWLEWKKSEKETT